MPSLPHYQVASGNQIVRRGKGRVSPVTHHTTATRRTGSRFRFIGETIAELRKVVWLSRREVLYLSALVLIVSVTAGIILGVVDFAFAGLVEKVFLGR